jgi:hypothetical protein
MLQESAKLWIEIWNRSNQGSGVVYVSLEGLSDSAGLQGMNEFKLAWGYLLDIGALAYLSDDELRVLEAGRPVPGRVVALTSVQDATFLRVCSPQDIYTRILAQFNLRRGMADDLCKATAIEVATKIGLSPEQLSEAKSYPLSDSDWRSLYMMPIDFFPRAWRRMEESGNAGQMMRIAAVLARAIDDQLPPGEHRVDLTAALEFVSKAIELAGKTTSHGQQAREPIPEAVRHEVWRRDQGRCVKCGSQEKLEFDHIIPHSKGGADTARNVQLLCERCNRIKGDLI